MRKVQIDELRHGMLIGQDVYNEQGQILLKRGTALTPGYIDGLKARTYPAVWVMDGIADDIEPPDILSPRLRAATSAHLQNLFLTAQSLDFREDVVQPEVVEEFATATRSQLAEIYRDAERLVGEVASAKTISGVMAIKSHDNYTFEHSIEVAIAAALLGQRVGLEQYDLESLVVGCLFHDVGKVVVPTAILNKPACLTDEEFRIIRRHPETGFQLARKALGEGAIIARNVIRQHHERQDGKGYPQGLRGTNRFDLAERKHFGDPTIIPSAEIAAVADIYSALASDRPYRASMNPEEVIDVFKKLAGPHLNRELVVRFLSMLPAYPIGSEVVIVAGKLRGYRGIVTKLTPSALYRPVVRILFDPRGRQIAPVEIDMAVEKEMDLASFSYDSLVRIGCD